MDNFEYSLPTNIVFGENRSAEAGDFCAKYNAKKVLIAYSGEYVKKSGLFDKVISTFKKNNLEYVEFPKVVPNPTLESVEEAYQLFKKECCDFILSIGGGSAIDTGKALALAVEVGSTEELWNRVFLNMDESVVTKVRSGVVLTTASSGSETGESCVISHDGKKLIGTSSSCQPAFAILDPATLLTLPAFQTACGAADILSHLEERYFTQVKDNDLTDRWLESAMRLVIQTAELLTVHPTDVSLRAQLMLTATLGHNGLLDRGRGGDWACHMIEHEISARLSVVHGEGIAMITPSWLTFVSKKPECRDRMIQFASRVWGAEFPNDTDKSIELAILRQKAWYEKMGLRTSLSKVEGFTEEMAKEIASSFQWQPGGFALLNNDDILAVLKGAMN